MIRLYEAKFKYRDTPEEHFVNVVGYTDDDKLGRLYKRYDDLGMGEKNHDKLDLVLIDELGIDDSEVCFYCNLTDGRPMETALIEDHDLILISLKDITPKKEKE